MTEIVHAVLLLLHGDAAEAGSLQATALGVAMLSLLVTCVAIGVGMVWRRRSGR